MEREKGENSGRFLRLAARISIKFMVTVAVVLAIILGGRSAYHFGYSVFNEEAMSYYPGKNVTIRITESMTVRDIAEVLEKNGLIKNANLFYIQNKISPYSGTMKAGRYTLNTSMKPREMMQILSGESEEEEEQE